MVDEALNDGARFAGACRGTGATVGAVGAVGAAVSLRAEDWGYRAGLADVVAGLA